mmetsp:Transcript_1690/g.1771  ORF Transcript_1690/g.1771 Transcript_1690/m.1771 type:complete len:179 (-) Transcript_1690:77-613(-)|eukprot:CAMPEP_0182433120 /NCGR_PEP_ID=MMETSP1167-20130531/60992_1 /TAXON_ID=2988 /ORGANISM="Mallomonas Sp, Strain CCMP3275" /LENGTH=178 /DNA_ID=CAMNT_0024621411 /DNA_START=1 /DNA_END=537 /DNA_ORIENTATION=-
MTEVYSDYPADLTAILPPGDIDIDFDTVNCELGGQEVDIVEDSELLRDVFEIGDKSSITFPTNTSNKMLVMFIKSIGKYVEISLRVTDEEGLTRRIVISNNRSIVAADERLARLPLQLGTGWQYMCVDIADMSKRCFGATHSVTEDVQIRGPSRLSKMFFQSKPHADVELPLFLRVIS